MNTTVVTKIYPAPEFDISEIMRYSQDRDMVLKTDIENCIIEVKDKLEYKVCYIKVPINIVGDDVFILDYKITSKSLAKHLGDSNSVIIFAATVGIGIDRMIAKYGRISPLKALIFQAIGAERIESLCDAFESEIKQQNTISQRFSPGYADFDIEHQKKLFSILNCEKNIGLTLNDSLLMSPSKSVTAIIGISDCINEKKKSCENCENKDCEYRRN